MQIKDKKMYLKVVKLDEDFVRRLYDYLNQKYETVMLLAKFDKNKSEEFDSCDLFTDFFDKNEYLIDCLYIIAGKAKDNAKWHRHNFMVRFGCDEYNHYFYGVEISYEDNDNEELIRTVMYKIEELIRSNCVGYGWASSVLLSPITLLISLFTLFLGAGLYSDYPKIALALLVTSSSILLIGLLGSIFKWKKKLFPLAQFWIKSTNIKHQEKLSTIRKTVFGTILGGTLLSIVGSLLFELIN